MCQCVLSDFYHHIEYLQSVVLSVFDSQICLLLKDDATKGFYFDREMPPNQLSCCGLV